MTIHPITLKDYNTTMSTILIAEDHPITSRILSFVLQNSGYNVLVATNGKEALEHMESLEVDLLITDLYMPHMDGITLVKSLRSDERYTELPIILTSVSGEDCISLEAKASGADMFITKPIIPNELPMVIGDLIQA